MQKFFWKVIDIIKKKIMLHLIMPKQVSGPNTAARKIAESTLFLKEYDFEFLVQNYHAGGKISFKLIRDLKRQIQNFKPDLIHISGLQSSGFHAVLAARLAGYKNIFVTIRGFSGDAIYLSKIKRFVFSHFIEPYTLKLCRYFVTVCKEAAEKDMVKKNSKKFLQVVHNSAPVIDFDTEEKRQIIRNRLGVKKSDFLVVVSGRMVYDKGLEYIANAMKQLKDNDIRFVFIGDGPYLKSFKIRFKRGDFNVSTR